MSKQIYIECNSCEGTGLYQGFMEQPHQAVICYYCSGTGRSLLKYQPYTGRKQKRGITQVRAGSGTILDSTKEGWMPLVEFEKKIPAAKVS